MARWPFPWPPLPRWLPAFSPHVVMPDTVTVAHVTTKWFPSDDLGRIYSGTCRECGARVTLDGSRYSTWDAPEAPRLTPAECPPPGHQRPFQY